VTGHEEIKAALQGFLAVKPRMEGRIEKVLEAGDTALVTNRWRLTGTAPDGSPVRMEATSADVLRRRPDGSWGIVIDDPWGATS
jgi:ketosteroid isomerase-like protein